MYVYILSIKMNKYMVDNVNYYLDENDKENHMIIDEMVSFSECSIWSLYY